MRTALLIWSNLLGLFVLALPGSCAAAEPPKVARLPSPQAEARTQVLIHGEFLEISRKEMAARGFDLAQHDKLVRQILEDQRAVEAANDSVDHAAAAKRLAEFRTALDALKKARIAKVAGEPTIVTVPGRPIHYRTGKNLEDTPGLTQFLGNELHCNVELRPAGRVLLDWKVNTDGTECTGKSLVNDREISVARVQAGKNNRGGGSDSDKQSEDIEYIFLLTPEVVTAMAHAPVVPSLPKNQGREILLRAEVWEVSWTRLQQMGFDFTMASGESISCADMLGPNAPPHAMDGFLDTLRQDLLAQRIAEHELVIPDGRSGRVKAGAEFLTSSLLREEKARPQTTFLGTEGTYEVDIKEDHTVAVEFNLAVNRLHDEIKIADGETIPPRVGKREITSGLTLKPGEPATLSSRYKRKRKGIRTNPENENDWKYVAEVEEVVLLIVMRAELTNPNTASLPAVTPTQK